MQRAMTHKEEERAQNETCDPVLAPGTKPARPRPCQHDRARDCVADASRDQRRNGLDSVADGQVRRTPHEINRGEGKRQLDAVGAVVVACGLTSVGYDHESASYIYHSAADGAELCFTIAARRSRRGTARATHAAERQSASPSLDSIAAHR